MTAPTGAAETDGAGDDWPGPAAPTRHAPVAAAGGSTSAVTSKSHEPPFLPPFHVHGAPARRQVFFFQ